MSRTGLLMHNRKEGSEGSRSQACSISVKKAYSGETAHFEFIAQERPEKVLKSCLIPIMNNEGSVSKVMGITEDITERKRIEKRQNQIKLRRLNPVLSRRKYSFFDHTP